MLDIFSRSYVDWFLKKKYCDILNKYDAVMVKIENEEFMGCMRGKPFIYVHSSKYFKIALRGKCMERNNLCIRNIYCIS